MATREYVTREGCVVTDHGDEIVMQVPARESATVIDFPGANRDWLMRAVSSTPYAEVRDEV